MCCDLFAYSIGVNVVAYFDAQNSTIRHVQCIWKIPVSSSTKKCTFCKMYRDNVLRSGLSRMLKQQEDDGKLCATNSHVNYRYLNTPEKMERMQNLHTMIRLNIKRIYQLQNQLDKIIKVDGVQIDETLNKDFLALASKHQEKVSAEDETFSSVFWQQQVKASSVKSPKGMRWHPAMIRWCLYLHHKSSGCYSTLRDSGVIQLPSERTLRDYRHSSPSTAGFSKATDLDLLEAIEQQKPRQLAKYVNIILDEMYVKEGLFFDKHSGRLVGYADLGEVNNMLSDYEQQFNSLGRTPRPLSKCMLVFMIRGLFTSLKYPYIQFPAASTKGADIFPLIRQAIKHLTRLGLCVISITCDGASDNRRMFYMHDPSSDLCYKTLNIYRDDFKEIFFISDPPHLIKTIRNCFARGKLWVSDCFPSVARH